jgi:hypothetical protein
LKGSAQKQRIPEYSVPVNPELMVCISSSGQKQDELRQGDRRKANLNCIDQVEELLSVI